jgi:hypothetical protein
VLVAAALAAVTASRGGHGQLLLMAGGLALVTLLLGLVARWSAALAVGIALLGAQQALRLALGPDALDSWTPVSAGALLLAAELAWWSIEPRVPAWAQPGLASRRLAAVLLGCGAASLVSGAVLVVSGAQVGGGFAMELVGVLAATAALAVVAWVTRRAVG